MKISTIHRKMSARLHRSLEESLSQTLPNLKMVGLLGAVGFPLFYVVWTHWLPQDADSALLRGVGFLLSVGFLFHQKWQFRYPAFFRLFWIFGFIYTLSFFFVYHLLANHGSLVWSMSALVGLMLIVVLVSDWILTALFNLIGASLALAVYTFEMGGVVNYSNYQEQLPVFLFALITGSVFNHRTAIVRVARQRALTALGASVAHELKAPLLTIETEAEALRRSVVGLNAPDDCVAQVDSIRAGQAHASTIIEMLLVGVASSDTSLHETESLSARDMLDSMLHRYPFRSSRDKEKVTKSMSAEFTVSGSELLIMHVLFNLLKNAFRAIEDQPDGEITVIADLDADSGRPVIRVRDNGCGIAPSVLPRVFDDFFTTSRLGRGSGIGLAFCKRVMKQHGGEIRCESEYGLWTEFTLLFPRSPMEANPLSRDQRASERSTQAWLSPGQAALIVDDEEINRKRLASMIAGRLRCDFAGSVREARARLHTQAYAVIFCDQHMPGGQGADFLAELSLDTGKPGQPQTRRILVSGDWTLTQQSLPGVDGILLKPLEQAKVDALFVTPEAASAVAERHKPVSEPLLHLAHDLCSPLSALEHLCERMHGLFASLEGLNARLPHEHRLRDEEVSALQSLPQQFERVASLAREKILRLRNEGEAMPPSFPVEMHRLWRNSDMLCRLTLQPTLPKLLSGLERSEQCVNGELADRVLRDLRTLTSECTQLHEHAMSLLHLHRKVGSQEVREVVGAD